MGNMYDLLNTAVHAFWKGDYDKAKNIASDLIESLWGILRCSSSETLSFAYITRGMAGIMAGDPPDSALADLAMANAVSIYPREIYRFWQQWQDYIKEKDNDKQGV